MTKRDFLHQYMLNRACASIGDPAADLELAVQAIAALEHHGADFDEAEP